MSAAGENFQSVMLVVSSWKPRNDLVRVRGPVWDPTMDVAGFPNRFCISLDYPSLGWPRNH